MTDLLKLLAGFDDPVRQKLIAFIEKHREAKGYRKVAVFDADGTLWRGDSGEGFFQYQVTRQTVPHAPKRKPWDYYLKESTSGDTAKAFGWLAQWNRDVREDDLRRWTGEFFEKEWRKHVFSPMRELAHALLNSGFEIWVVSGSIRWVIEKGVEGFGVRPERVLATAVEVKDGILTDTIVGFVPYRSGKAKMIKQEINHPPLFAAGNTSWDKEMLELATELVLTVNSESKGDPNFDSEQRLSRLAVENGWLVQRF